VSDPPAPPVGNMYLYDSITPPLLDGSYHFNVQTNVKVEGNSEPLSAADSYFNIEGPRFSLSPAEVGGVFPPNNGHGDFSDTIAHVALTRRTMPWERDPLLPPPLDATGAVIEGINAPWLALLVFEETDDYKVLKNVPLQQVLPPDVYQTLAPPAGVTCDALDVNRFLLNSIMPSVEELTLLTHVRQVNVDDRELSAGDSGGWFAVVMSNRLPNPGAKCQACLVSVEGRSDLVPQTPPPSITPRPIVFTVGPIEGDVLRPPSASGNSGTSPAPAATHVAAPNIAIALPPEGAGPSRAINISANFLRDRLVLLYSWKFETNFTGTFRELMQALDVGMIGKVAEVGHPPLTDTFHVPIPLGDRAGEQETVLYRGPLVPFPLTRDSLGPYHSADQCRRATPETGTEDISYAAAFEVGRLLAASDPRLAQELMRWRRESYKQASRRDVMVAVQKVLPMFQPLDLHTPWMPVMSASASERFVKGAGPIADAYGLAQVSRAPGLDPNQLQLAWNLPDVQTANTILQGDPGGIGLSVEPPQQTPRVNTTIDSVAADQASLTRLTNARNQTLANAQQKLGG
jgi:hypothetical protein